MRGVEVHKFFFAFDLIDEGFVSAPPMFQFVLGVKWASPADTRTVEYLRSYLPAGSQWTAMGIGRDQMRMVAQSVTLGGHVRVGLEDNLYLRRGEFATKPSRAGTSQQ